MTRNNLNKHLHWLLSGRQSASTVHVPNYPVQDTSRTEEESQRPEFFCSDSRPHELEAPSIGNVTSVIRLSRQSQPELRKDHPLPALQVDMARLQSEPRLLKKSQVTSRGSPINQQLATPTLSTPRGKQLARGNSAVVESPIKGKLLCLWNNDTNHSIR